MLRRRPVAHSGTRLPYRQLRLRRTACLLELQKLVGDCVRGFAHFAPAMLVSRAYVCLNGIATSVLQTFQFCQQRVTSIGHGLPHCADHIPFTPTLALSAINRCSPVRSRSR